ncbi:TetR/AcrR family transcriptional regulator [Agromyces soli]|uniref:TetR family transcriptional regulator n=1 Tax=Agromyces soli TaxID=659012 RepID=A0ABY4ASC5_9MICO|nr:TetR/AcrR family transcriptional regulator [Agromyces soli]UOE24768.1 TetR family transcriptional regulator [Agromyces soli]
MPRASAEDAARTARSIVDTATSLFAESGYAAVALEDVAAAAGVTRGAVYHHYASKRGLFTAVVARLQERVASAVVSAADQAGPDAAAQLRAGCLAFLDAVTDAAAVRTLLVDAPAVIGWAEWRQLDAEHSVVHLREALAATGITGALLDPLTAMLSGAMNDAALWLAEHPADATARAAAHRSLDLLVDAAIAQANAGDR